ncbi:DNA primase family protein [Streptomyces luteolus]|uniref:Phage/plasmid primase, P4 family n=1 Tax=Streptomyces luteolus TaxID=3043615 RepID=A0ABT6STB6_9ACTN|nr:phage/plasmid primase, P4 family [Streptomyces sp. B-S-A12]MDI3417897.1 phage/plasmid primase, P4 family [Streptomyces sp. B-S-A12]
MNDTTIPIPPPTDPMAVARHLAPAWQQDDLLTLRHWRGAWMAWEGSHWRELDPQQLRASLYEQLEHAQFEHATPKGAELRKWAPNIRKVADLMASVAAVTHLPPTIDAPAWTARDQGNALRRDGTRDETGHGTGPIVACTNGLLRVADRALTPLTPGFFNLVSVPFDYDPKATAPAWEKFLHQVWPDDPHSIAALQEWFGYVLSGRTDQQKILLVVGPPRSGKGTLARVLADLVGKGNMAGPTLASLGSNFGLSPLLGKSLAVVSDARLSGRDGHQVVERLLTISGEDTIDVDRKFKDPWTGKLPTRLVILSNELPNFGDASGAIARRFVVLNTTVSWLGKENTSLADELADEMPGILNWSLEGLDRVQKTGRLTEPPASRDAVTTMQDTASPTSAFIRECCETGPACQVVVDDLWAVWRSWADDNGIRAGTKQVFGRNLQSVVPQVRRTKPRGDDGRQIPVYVGLALADGAHNALSRGSSRLNEQGPNGYGKSLSRDEPDKRRDETEESRTPVTPLPALIRAEPHETRFIENSGAQQELAGLSRDEPRLTLLQPSLESAPLCTECGGPFEPLEAGQTTHPTCTPAIGGKAS